MRRVVDSFCLVLTCLVMLSGCGGSSDSSTNVVTDPPAPPEDGITGRVASGIAGAALSVQDANGLEIVLASGRTTRSDGSFALIFSEFAIDDGITAPLLVSLDGTDATGICDFNKEGDNDCLSADGSFVTFGERYTLPDGFTLRALIPEFPEAGSVEPRTTSVNISTASELAVGYMANLSSLIASDVNLANQQALGVVEFVTGLSTKGRAINDIAMVDLAQPTTSTIATDALALAIFGASLHGRVTTEVTRLSNYQRVLNQTAASIRPAQSSSTGQLSATGKFLAEIITAYLTTATSFQTSLTEPSAVLSGSIASQTNVLPLLSTAGNNTINIALPADPLSTDAVDRARTFVSRLSEVMGASLLISSASGFGGTATGTEIVFADQQQLVTSLVSDELRATFRQLDQAVSDASTNNETQLSGTNVSGVLSFEGSTTTLTNATSSSSNIQTGISVNITIQNATRTGTGDAGTLDASEITISISQTQNDLTTQLLYDGVMTLDMIATSQGTDIEAIEYNGSLRSANALEFSGSVSISDLSPANTAPISGAYAASFSFSSGTSLNMNGRFETQVLQYSISTGSSTVTADLQTNVITDMTATLNLTLDNEGKVSGGNIVSSEQDTATMDSNGIVTYADGTTTSLPSPII